MNWKTVAITEENWERMQELASPFRSSELGTVDKVLTMLLDSYEANELPPVEAEQEPTRA